MTSSGLPVFPVGMVGGVSSASHWEGPLPPRAARSSPPVAIRPRQPRPPRPPQPTTIPTSVPAVTAPAASVAATTAAGLPARRQAAASCPPPRPMCRMRTSRRPRPSSRSPSCRAGAARSRSPRRRSGRPPSPHDQNQWWQELDKRDRRDAGLHARAAAAVHREGDGADRLRRHPRHPAHLAALRARPVQGGAARRVHRSDALSDRRRAQGVPEPRAVPRLRLEECRDQGQTLRRAPPQSGNRPGAPLPAGLGGETRAPPPRRTPTTSSPSSPR